MSGKPRVNLPQSIKAGDVIEVRSLISHVMETGNRKDNTGNVVPRNIINTFSATFAGKDVFRAELNSGISANPFISFHMRVPGPGMLELTWVDDAGIKTVEQVTVAVT